MGMSKYIFSLNNNPNRTIQSNRIHLPSPLPADIFIVT